MGSVRGQSEDAAASCHNEFQAKMSSTAALRYSLKSVPPEEIDTWGGSLIFIKLGVLYNGDNQVRFGRADNFSVHVKLESRITLRYVCGEVRSPIHYCATNGTHRDVTVHVVKN